jgi:HSP20 family protein
MSQVLPEGRTRSGSPERWEPQGELEQVNERLRRLLEQSFGGLPVLLREAAAWAPPVDIEEEDDAYVIEAEVPGVKRDDVKIDLVGREMTISGEIKERERKGILRRQTRRVGQFEYRVILPDEVDGDGVEAKLKDGVLSVRVPKAERAQRRRIEVKPS